jgi:hypothetical protein
LTVELDERLAALLRAVDVDVEDDELARLDGDADVRVGCLRPPLRDLVRVLGRLKVSARALERDLGARLQREHVPAT